MVDVGHSQECSSRVGMVGQSEINDAMKYMDSNTLIRFVSPIVSRRLKMRGKRGHSSHFAKIYWPEESI